MKTQYSLYLLHSYAAGGLNICHKGLGHTSHAVGIWYVMCTNSWPLILKIIYNNYLYRKRLLLKQVNKTFVYYRAWSFIGCTASKHTYIELLLFIRSPSFTFAGIQQLKNTRYLFGIGSNNITLSYWSHMKNFAVLLKNKNNRPVIKIS